MGFWYTIRKITHNFMSIIKLYKHFYIALFFTLAWADESWKVYDDSEMATITIILDEEDLDWMYSWDNLESDSLHLASIHFQNGYINETIDSVGFRLRGNTSRSSAKKSFKVDFNHFVPGRDFFGIEKLNLNGEHNDPSIVRSRLCWDFYERIDMISSRSVHAKVYINEEYFGLYVSVEHIDDTFLSKNFKNDNGNLWKCLWPADLTYRGNDSEDYFPYYDDKRPYELKTNRDEYDYSKLARLIRIINQTPDSLDLVLDSKKALQYFAMNVLTGGWDDYRFLRNNYYLYHNPSDDMIHWIPYDYDNTVGIDWFDINWGTINPYDYAVIDNDGRPLTDYMFSQSRYRNLFSHFLEFYRERLLNIDELEIKLDQIIDDIYIAVEEDQYRTMDYGFSMDDFINSYGYEFELQHVKKGILEFFSDRNTSLNEQITFDNQIPIIYETNLENEIIVVDDTVSIHISLYGDPTNFHLFYMKDSNQTWNSVVPSYEPDLNSDKVEDHDRWIANFVPEESGHYYWYIIAGNEEGSERYPVYDFNKFHVIEEIQMQPVIINELLADNQTINSDDNGDFDDWVELHNYSNVAVNLAGFYLTDKMNNLTKWKFPDSGSIITPQGYLLIWCDEDQDQEGLHTNFKLSSNGEFLGLILPDGETFVDSISFPVQEQDISYGINSSGNWSFLTPSPGLSNVGMSTSENHILQNFQVNKLYPNPFNSTINIDINHNQTMNNVSLDIISINGRSIYSSSINLQGTGKSTISVDFDGHIASGCYLLRIGSFEKFMTRKILYLK